MNMENRLPGIGIGVGDDPEAALRHAALTGDGGGNPENMSDQMVIFGQQVKNPDDVFARNQQQMERRCRIDVFNYQQLFILVHHLCRNLSSGNPAEKTRHNLPLS